MKTPRLFPATLALGALLLLAADALAENDRVALVIGNSAYQGPGRLPNPVNDAALLRDVLRRCGFDVLHYSDLDKKGMKGAIATFHDRIKTGGVALFFYAGHGIQVAGTNYLVPVDSKLEHEFEVEDECIPLNRVYGAMGKGGTADKPKAAVNIILLDCCRNNPFARGWRDARQGLAAEYPPSRCLIGFAASPGKTADDGAGANSPYTQALARQIPNRGLEITDMLRVVANHVYSQTRELQRPWQQNDLLEEFFFVPGEPQQSPPQPPPQAEAPPTAEPLVKKPAPNPRSDDAVLDVVRRAFNANNENSVGAFFPYLQLPMENYFGKRRADRAHILADRRRYLNRWPAREFRLTEPPEISRRLDNGDYAVVTKAAYSVRNTATGKTGSGRAITAWKVRPVGDGDFKVIYMDEYVERSPSLLAPQPLPVALSAPAAAVSHDEEKLKKFVVAFDLSGAINDATATSQFYAASVENYFGKRNLSRADIVTDRRNYIRKWPIRSYDPQKYEVTQSTARGATVVYTSRWTVSDGSKEKSGVATTTMKITLTSDGYRIYWIDQKKD